MVESSSNQSPFVTQIDLSLKNKIVQDLKDQGFELDHPQYTLFSAKKKGVVCTLYESGKMVVQGKDKQAFIEFYLEPEILGTFKFTNPMVGVDMTPHIGIDESGKGDFFGPLCIAGVYAGGEQLAELQAIGVKDSKKLGDVAIHKIAEKIKGRFPHHIVKINPQKYNEIYSSFNNLNTLLAWGHATTIEHMIQKTNCDNVIIDQFANESVVKNALKRKKLSLNLTQRHRGEEDIVVAAASILARDAFVNGLSMLSKQIGIELPKGASAAVIAAGKRIVKELGEASLLTVCKQHFKMINTILGYKE